ncbi:MAG: enoyl-CoA hydratase/isomerase family protein [Actinobacteria bacterium]|nr:enoyl-CoA hydratase/isomerase family protein [Actinomycetota bacterium]
MERPAHWGDEPVHVDLEDGVLTITIDRPDNRNALSTEVRAGLWVAFRRVVEDDDVLVAVLTATGERVFCAGGDLKEMSATTLRVPPADFFPVLGDNIHTDKPVIAAVNGVALAGGFALAQMCDLCIAADHATFGVTEAKWSRGMPWAAPLPWLVPPRVALELFLTAEPIDAARAQELGLVNRVVPAAEVVPTAQELARRIAGNAPLTVRAAKRMVYEVAGMGLPEARRHADAIFEPVYLSDDAQEGPRAFAEKRPPRWSGR